jgi:tetratricopeptide (TPR) repeat protein
VPDSPPHGPEPRVWGKVPPRNRNFTGREEIIDQLRQGVESQVTAVLPRALHGIGGVGKTQVAIEYAYRYRSHYDVVWWVSADQPSLVPSSLAALAQSLNLPSARTTGIEDAAMAVLEALRRGEPYEHWLLIFDNADDPDDIQKFIPQTSGHVLITSRNQAWVGVVDTVEVDVFSRKESLAFLGRRVPRALSDAQATQLAETLGDLPLALEQAGALQAETGMSVEEYIDLLGEQPAELLGQIRPSEYPASMTAAWQLSVSKLQEQRSEALLILRACAFFGPDPIPLDVFRRNSIGAGPLLNTVLANPILRTEAVRMLGRFALGRIDPVNRTIQVHRLIQALLQQDMDDAQRAEFREEVHLLLAGAAPENPSDEAQWPRYTELMTHVAPAMLVASTHPDVRQFVIKMIRYLGLSGNTTPALSLCRECLDRWIDDSGEEDLAVLRAQWQLGFLLRDIGQLNEAYKLDERAMSVARRVLGESHETFLTVMNSFGVDLRARGDFTRAKTHDEISRRLHTSVLGDEHPLTLGVLNNLALDYALNSNYREARDMHQQVFSMQSAATTGISRTEVLRSWLNLSRAVRLSGEYSKACYLGEDALDFGRQELGAENPVTLLTSKELSIALRRAGSHTDSLELAEELYERTTKLFGKNAPDTLAAAICLANILRTVGHIAEAHELTNDVMTRYPDVYGSEHPFTYGCIGNLALIMRVRGDIGKARELNEQALDGLVSRLSKDHHYTLTIAVNLATDLYTLGEAASARDIGADAFARVRHLFGDEHPFTLGSAANLSLSLRATGAEEEARTLIDSTMATYNKVLGPDHPDVRVAREGRHLDFDFDPPPL